MPVPAAGKGSNMVDIVADLKEDGEYERIRDSLTEDEKEALIKQLAEHRDTKAHAPRATNNACRQDAVQVANRVQQVVSAVCIFIDVGADYLASFMISSSALESPPSRCSLEGTPTTQ